MNGERFFYMLPKLIVDISALKELLITEDREFERVEEKLDEFVNNSYLSTIVDERAVEVYEKLFNIKTFGDLETRRSMLIAKLRGAGTTTPALVKNVPTSFSYGEVDVITENEKYVVRIKFISEKGLPKNLESIKNSLAEVIPAHLHIVYEFTYTTWGEHNQNRTWGELLQGTWNDAKVI